MTGVLTAVYGLIDITALRQMFRASLMDFFNALAALFGVLLAYASAPHVAVIRRIPGTAAFSGSLRHTENEPLAGASAIRPEASLLYLNAEHVLASILAHLDTAQASGIRTVFGDLSAASMMDLAGARTRARTYRTSCARVASALSSPEPPGGCATCCKGEGLQDEILVSGRGSTLEGELCAFSAKAGSSAAEFAEG